MKYWNTSVAYSDFYGSVLLYKFWSNEKRRLYEFAFRVVCSNLKGYLRAFENRPDFDMSYADRFEKWKI